MGHFLPVFVDTPLHSRRPKELVGYASKAFASELSLLSQGSESLHHTEGRGLDILRMLAILVLLHVLLICTDYLSQNTAVVSSLCLCGVCRVGYRGGAG
jgi:hypothetical protein